MIWKSQEQLYRMVFRIFLIETGPEREKINKLSITETISTMFNVEKLDTILEINYLS